MAPLTLSSRCRILSVGQSKSVVPHVLSRVIGADINSDDVVIPWTIVNKYYTADVHFSVQDLAELVSPVDEGTKVPAIVYVFDRREPFRAAFLAAHTKFLDAHDPEIALAVGLTLPDSSRKVNSEEDDETLEDFFADRGFEFINISHDEPSLSTNDVDNHDVSGIARIREALHTVMWPSLIRSGSERKTKTQAPPIPVILDDGAGGIRLTVDDLTNDMALSLFTSPDGHVDDRDFEALEKWLDDDDSDPWNTPTPKNPLAGEHIPLVGFEDDFAEFVSAPPVPSDTTDTPNSYPTTSFAFFDDDTLLPSESEVRAASSRIFSSARGVGSDGIGSFDLSLVMSALQAMKEEISGIEDEDERRRAAARVALGLVEGLGLDFDDVDGNGLEESVLGEEIRVE